jgi:hypothetical protein
MSLQAGPLDPLTDCQTDSLPACTRVPAPSISKGPEFYFPDSPADARFQGAGTVIKSALPPPGGRASDAQLRHHPSDINVMRHPGDRAAVRFHDQDGANVDGLTGRWLSHQ